MMLASMCDFDLLLAVIPDPCGDSRRYMMYRYSSFAPSVYDWAFDTYHDGKIISYYLSAYYQSFLMIVGNYQV